MQRFRKAVDHGHTGAQANLGLMYYNVQVAPQNYVLAHMWAKLAAECQAPQFKQCVEGRRNE